MSGFHCVVTKEEKQRKGNRTTLAGNRNEGFENHSNNYERKPNKAFNIKQNNGNALPCETG